MQIVETKVEPLDAGKFRISIIVEEDSGGASREAPMTRIGAGPTGNAVPDKIVRVLINNRPHSMTLAAIQREVGGNPGTVSRQAWTLATNQPDLQIRLRGWVISSERGRYELSGAARQLLDLEASA
jgi:hypothetical protein